MIDASCVRQSLCSLLVFSHHPLEQGVLVSLLRQPLLQVLLAVLHREQRPTRLRQLSPTVGQLVGQGRHLVGVASDGRDVALHDSLVDRLGAVVTGVARVLARACISGFSIISWTELTFL